MQTYEMILANLTDAQKLHILTDIRYLSSSACKELDIPDIKVGNMKNYLRDLYPHATALSHAWDTELWRRVARDKLRAMQTEDVNFAIVPGARIKLSPYRKEITEDPFLASAFSASHQISAVEAGLVSGVSGCYLTEPDLTFLDDAPDARVIHEYVTKPYIDSVTKGKAEAIISSGRALQGEYKNFNLSIQGEALRDGKRVICEWAGDEATVACIANGGICFEGSYVALDIALKKYRTLKKSIEKGYASMEELETAIAEYSAIAPETIDLAVTRVLDLAYACHKGSSGTAIEGIDSNQMETAYRATADSIVLLKNKGSMLPLKKETKIALVGDVAYQDGKLANSLIARCEEMLTAWGAQCVGCARGYELPDEEQTKITQKLKSVVDQADVVLMFLGFGEKRARTLHLAEKLTLPANQLRLADYLKKNNKKVVVVLESGHSVDIEFTRLFPAVVVAPLNVRYSAEALLRVLTGAEDPSGRLAYTLYAGTEEAFKKQRLYKQELHMKSGPFIGYRYYDTAQMRIGYPFGHGLSYGEVEYSRGSVNGASVTVTLHNLSDKDVCEVVQVYAGVPESNLLRPQKELCGFSKILLQPYEKRRVTIDLTLPNVYCDGTYSVEGGHYQIDIGHSVSDIRLSLTAFFNGKTFRKDGAHLSDYLQTASNIIHDKYTLEADYVPMKKSFKNLLFGIGSLILAISVGVFNMVTQQPTSFLGWIAAILAMAGVMFFLLHARERRLLHIEECDRIEKKNQEHFKNAETIPFASTQELFKEAFDADDEQYVNRENARAAEEEEYLHFAKNDFFFAQAAQEFRTFAQERGYRFERNACEGLFASLAASRLIIMDGMETAEFRNLMLLLGEYFDTKPYFDVVKDRQDSESATIFGYDEKHAPIMINPETTLKDAIKAPEKIHLVALDSVDPSTVCDYFNVFMPCLKSANLPVTLLVRDMRDKLVKYPIKGNVWFVVNPKSSCSATEMPRELLTVAVGLHMKYETGEIAENHTAVEQFTYYQLRYLIDRLEKTQVLAEDDWKKIDKLEAYVRDHNDYRIGNKLWLNMERHMMALTECGVEMSDALDESVCANLLPSVLSALNGHEGEDETISETIDLIFGESTMPVCLKYVKHVAELEAQRRLEEERLAEESSEETAEEVVETATEEPADKDSTNEN